MNRIVRILRVPCLIACLILLSTLSAAAHQIVLKSGQVIGFENYRVTEEALLYTDGSGKELKVPLSEIDLDRTEDLNAIDPQPIELPGLIPTHHSSVASNGTQSLGDVARKNRLKSAQATTKRVWTSDDFSSAGETESPVSTETRKASASETLYEFRLLDKERLGAAVLKMAGVPDVEFSDRKDWEQRLFEAKQAWLDQVNRVDGHADSSKDAKNTEIRLAQGAQLNFERIAEQFCGAQLCLTRIDSWTLRVGSDSPVIRIV